MRLEWSSWECFLQREKEGEGGRPCQEWNPVRDIMTLSARVRGQLIHQVTIIAISDMVRFCDKWGLEYSHYASELERCDIGVHIPQARSLAEFRSSQKVPQSLWNVHLYSPKCAHFPFKCTLFTNMNNFPPKYQVYNQCMYIIHAYMHIYAYIYIFAYMHIRVWRIYSNIRIFEYFWYEYLFGHSFVSFFVYEYIRIFVRIKILLRIYSDIRSYQNFDTNIFGYSFVFLRIYSNISTYSFC